MYYLLLAITSLLMLLPIVYLKLKREKKLMLDLSNPIHYLEILLVITLSISFIHWLNPNKINEKEHSFICIVDGYLAKLSAFLILIYIIFIKKISLLYRLAGILLGATAITAFYFSNRASYSDWCSNKHIAYHLIFHIHCILILYIAFL